MINFQTPVAKIDNNDVTNKLEFVPIKMCPRFI